MDKKALILLGAGGHCASCIDVIEAAGEWSIEGVLDRTAGSGNVLGYSVVGSDADIENYRRKGYTFFITVGQIKFATVRESLFNLLKFNQAPVATISSPKAHVSR